MPQDVETIPLVSLPYKHTREPIKEGNMVSH
jgi:hypothetical protein